MRVLLLVLALLLQGCYVTEKQRYRQWSNANKHVKKDLFENSQKVGDVFSNSQFRVKVLESSAPVELKSIKSYEYRISDLENESFNRNWSKNKLNTKKENLSKEHYFTFKIKGGSIETVDTRLFEFVLVDLLNNTIKRYSPSPSVGNYTIDGRSTIWWNFSTFSVPSDLSPPYKIHVISNVTDIRRSTFLIESKKSLQSERNNQN